MARSEHTYRGELSRQAVVGISNWYRNRALRKCLFSSEECSGEIVRAHSVQSSHVLESICESGHVYMFLQQSPGNIALKLIGKNRATTFTGACSFHDRAVFRDIDFDDSRRFEPQSPRQQALLALRALACEYYKKQNVSLLHARLISLLDEGDTSEIQQELSVARATAEYMASQPSESLQWYLQGTREAENRMMRLFKSILNQIRNDRYTTLKTEVHTVEGPAAMAASSFFSPNLDLKGNVVNTHLLREDVAGIALTILPYEGSNWILMSYHRRHQNKLIPLLRQLRKEEEVGGLGIAVSRMVVLYCENVVFKPSIIESLSRPYREELEHIFSKTTFDSLPFDKVPAINLFATPKT